MSLLSSDRKKNMLSLLSQIDPSNQPEPDDAQAPDAEPVIPGNSAASGNATSGSTAAGGKRINRKSLSLLSIMSQAHDEEQTKLQA